MRIHLFPQRPDHPLADAKELKRILAELHVDKAANAVDELTSWFDSLKHARNFRLDHYFDVLRQLDDAGQLHLRRLARDYLYSSYLSRREQQRLWERSYGYWAAVAALYDLCTTRARLESKDRGTDAFKVSLPLADARLQAALRTCIKWLTYRYEPIEKDLWKGLGRTVLAAEAAGHAQKPVPLYPGPMSSSSVAQQYLHALVFSTSSMDSLVPQQIELADRLIAHFLPAFVCSPDCRAGSIYWVDATRGSAPARLARQPGAARPGLRFFSPGQALAGLEELIHVVERDEVPASLNLGGEFTQKALLPVLRHLRVCWALQPPQRRHQRHTVATRMAVLPGFDHSYTVFSGAAASLQAEAQSWVVENVSLGGLRTCFDDSSTDRITLGSLLCMQVEGGDNWLLGMARRFNRLAGGRANLGVQLLARQAQSIELRPRRSGFSAAVAIPGIWLHDGEVPGIVRIVLPLGGFSVRETLDFSQDGRLHLLTPMEVESTGSDYEIARYYDQSPA